MVFRGRVKNGTIVLHEPNALPDGTEVQVVVVNSDEKREQSQSLSDRLLKFAGASPGLPPYMAEQHDHYIHGTPKR